MRKVQLYSLLYIDLDENRQLAGKRRMGMERVQIFLRNAALLDASLRRTNPLLGGLKVITNNSSFIQKVLDQIGYNLEAVEIPFSLNVPKGIRFYSAHFKIDAFKWFALRPDDEYSILMDNDCLALREMPAYFSEIVDNGIPLCYYLPTTDCDRMMADCRRINPNIPLLQWTGGELWGGVSSFYSALYSYCVAEFSNYLKVIDDDIFHVGDEMLTTLALAKLKENGTQIIDARTLNLCYRYWGMHETASLNYLMPVLAHLPADKVWIAQYDLSRTFNVNEFLKKYNRHWRWYRFLNSIRKSIKTQNPVQ